MYLVIIFSYLKWLTKFLVMRDQMECLLVFKLELMLQILSISLQNGFSFSIILYLHIHQHSQAFACHIGENTGLMFLLSYNSGLGGFSINVELIALRTSRNEKCHPPFGRSFGSASLKL